MCIVWRLRMRGSRLGSGGPTHTHPPRKSQSYRVPWQSWSGLPENAQAKCTECYQANIQCKAIIGPQPKRHLNGMAFRWRSDDGTLKVVFGPIFPHQLKIKGCRSWTPLTKHSGSAHAVFDIYCLWPCSLAVPVLAGWV